MTDLPPFQSLIDEHEAVVRRFVGGLLGPDEAEDSVQETFLAALRAYPRFDGDNPRAWLLRIARNKAIDAHRGRARRPEPVADPEPPPASDGALEAADAELWDQVRRLPFKQRAAILLRFVADLRYREVGEALGSSEEAARRNVHEALGKLRIARGVKA